MRNRESRAVYPAGRGGTFSGWKKRCLQWMSCVLSLMLVFAAGVQAHGEALPAGEDGGKAPTCTESGFRVVEEQGVIRLEELPATGHAFDGWTTDNEARTRTHRCRTCGYEETIRISSIPEEQLSRLDMSGSLEGIGRKTRVTLELCYTDAEQSFRCCGLVTLQGHSSYGYPKKNYTIRFYDDAEGNDKHKVSFRGWKNEHKYILKANYFDVSQCRNLVGARIWADIVQTREALPKALSESPTYGAVDGFPVAVYLNGEFFGLYTLNLHKDDDLYRMKDGERNAVMICNKQTGDESLFRAEAAFLPNNESDWELEFCGTEDETWAKDSFNELVSFVMESDDGAFREHLSEYLDVDAAIDYLALIYALGLENSGAKDLVMLSYGERWIPSAFDMDEAFGLNVPELRYREPEEFLPSCSGSVWDSGTGSLLWDRLLNAFPEQVIKRWFELRGGALSEEKLLEGVDAFSSQIPESFYDLDWYLYPGRPEQFRIMEQQIRQYIPARLKLLDACFEGGKQ